MTATFDALRQFRKELDEISNDENPAEAHHEWLKREAISTILEVTDMERKMECDHDNCCWANFAMIMQDIVPLLVPSMFPYHQKVYDAFVKCHEEMKMAYIGSEIEQLLGDTDNG